MMRIRADYKSDVQTIARSTHPHRDSLQFNLAVALLAQRVGMWWEMMNESSAHIKIIGLPKEERE